jgi:hypothetical protein
MVILAVGTALGFGGLNEMIEFIAGAAGLIIARSPVAAA